MVGVTIRWPAKLSSISFGRAINRPVLAHIFGCPTGDFAEIIIVVEVLRKIRNHSAFIAARQPLKGSHSTCPQKLLQKINLPHGG
jgi:hypothetical protein